MKKIRHNQLLKHVVCFAMVSTMAVSDVMAATQGSLGETSTGSLDISVSKPARVRISDLNDLTLASWVTGDGAVSLKDDVCVYSSKAQGGYTVKATGSGAGSAFTLANGDSVLPYSVTWNSGGVGALADTGTQLVSNVTSAKMTGAARDSSSCTGSTPGPTARIIVGMLATDMDAAVDGTYNGTLTLLVTPN
jgi:hypothetical protein